MGSIVDKYFLVNSAVNLLELAVIRTCEVVFFHLDVLDLIFLAKH
jgi:hypothetical protein